MKPDKIINDNMDRIITMALAALLLCSCMIDPADDGTTGTGNREGVEIPVEFNVFSIDSAHTRSSISASETTVKDINIYAYHNGRLEKAAYFESVDNITVSLIRDRKYNLYALSNMGKLTPPDLEEDMLGTKFSMGHVIFINGGFPMSWSQAGFMVNGIDPHVDITLVRLVCRISFSIDKSALDNLVVTKVRLCQSAMHIYPFGSESKAEAAAEVSNGDYASTQDIVALNSGETISFYAYENCQGVLLPGNVNAESKVPTSIPANSTLCTYLEMTASYSGQYDGVDVSSDNVKYRFYLGADNCSDFNVKRNTDIKINLEVTEDRIFDESWRISYGNDLPTVSHGLEFSSDDTEVGIGLSTTLPVNYYRSVDGVHDQYTDVTSYAAWTSSDESVALVTGGTVYGITKGTAVITATYNGYRISREITVKDVISESLILTPSGLEVINGRTGKLTAILATYLNGAQTGATELSARCTWESDNTSAATVDGIGLVTGNGIGTATVTAHYEGYTASAEVTVVPATRRVLTITPADLRIGIGREEQLTATYNIYEDGELKSSTNVTASAVWITSSSTTAEVDKGLVKGNRIGPVTITASYNDLTCKASVLVQGPPTMSLGWKSKAIKRGDVITNVAIYHPNDGSSSKNVTASASWTTSNPGIATVGNGTISGHSPGTAIVTATWNGTSASCAVTLLKDVNIAPNTYVAGLSVFPVNISGSYYKLMLSMKLNDGTVVEDVPYTWAINYAQSPDIPAGLQGEGPIIYTGNAGNSYLMSVSITTVGHYKDSNGDSRKLSTEASFNHDIQWTP